MSNDSDFDQVADMLLVLTDTLHCESANRAFYAFTGLTSSQLAALDLREIVDDERQRGHGELVSSLRALENGQHVASILTRIRTASGDKEWTDWSARRSQDRIFCVLRSAQERVWRESLNLAEQKILAAVIAGRSLGSILDLACREFEVLIPEACCSILLVDIASNCLMVGAAPSLPGTFTAAVQGLPVGPEVGSCGTAVARRETIITRDIARDPRWATAVDLAARHGLAACWSTPLLDEDGRPLGTFAVYHRYPHVPPAHEMTVARIFSNAVTIAIKRQSDRDDLVRSYKLAVEASEAKSLFLAHMSHELRTPLNAIIGFSDALRSAAFGQLGSEQYECYAGHIYNSGRLLAGLIDGLLDLARIEAGTLELAEEDVAIFELVEKCTQFFQSPSGDAVPPITTMELPPGLMLRADRQAVMRVLLNLLSNAIKFTPPEGRISISGEIDDAGLALKVTDTGAGISEEGLAQIGKPFVRLRSESGQQNGGTGLGLFISRSIAERHGGDLAVASVIGRGTTVTIRFPRERIIAQGALSAPRHRERALQSS